MAHYIAPVAKSVDLIKVHRSSGTSENVLIEICFLTIRCHEILHLGPLNSFLFRITLVTHCKLQSHYFYFKVKMSDIKLSFRLIVNLVCLNLKL